MEISHILNTKMYPLSVSESSTSNIFLNLKGAQKETSSPHTTHKIRWWCNRYLWNATKNQTDSKALHAKRP